MADLKPCPFCGQNPSLAGAIGSLSAWASCLCGCSRTGVTDDAAVAAWNARPTERDAFLAGALAMQKEVARTVWSPHEGVRTGKIKPETLWWKHQRQREEARDDG